MPTRRDSRNVYRPAETETRDPELQGSPAAVQRVAYPLHELIDGDAVIFVGVKGETRRDTRARQADVDADYQLIDGDDQIAGAITDTDGTRLRRRRGGRGGLALCRRRGRTWGCWGWRAGLGRAWRHSRYRTGRLRVARRRAWGRLRWRRRAGVRWRCGTRWRATGRSRRGC